VGFKVVKQISSEGECQSVVCRILCTRKVVITSLSVQFELYESRKVGFCTENMTVAPAKFSVQCNVNMEPLFHPFTHTPVAVVNSTQ
jgi:hypothetical protein